MKNMTLENITKACGGTYVGSNEKKNCCIRGAVTDSRQIAEGFLFIPVRGARVDGHDFIPAVFQKGAIATLSEQPLPDCQKPYILVASCLQALKDIARFYRSQLTIPIVGITGSVGKTSTKEMVAAVLSTRFFVLKTDGNFNNEIGLPLTILRIQEEHQAAVLEMGISEFGEMHRLADIARPDVCIITNIGACHLENLKTRDGVLKAKTEVFAHLAPKAAVLLNGDDDKLRTIKTAGGNVPVFYGIKDAEIYVDAIQNKGLLGTSGLLHTPKGDIQIDVLMPGGHSIYNAMAAAGAGLALGLTVQEIAKGIGAAKTISGRSNLIETGGMVIIDDCYNANPASMTAAIDVLKEGANRTVAVLGDMGELGEEEQNLHRKVGAYAAKRQVDALFCAGTLAKEIETGARENGFAGQLFYYQTRDEMLPHLLAYLKAKDTVLVKASHFMDFACVVEALKKL